MSRLRTDSNTNICSVAGWLGAHLLRHVLDYSPSCSWNPDAYFAILAHMVATHWEATQQQFELSAPALLNAVVSKLNSHTPSQEDYGKHVRSCAFDDSVNNPRRDHTMHGLLSLAHAAALRLPPGSGNYSEFCRTFTATIYWDSRATRRFCEVNGTACAAVLQGALVA